MEIAGPFIIAISCAVVVRTDAGDDDQVLLSLFKNVRSCGCVLVRIQALIRIKRVLALFRVAISVNAVVFA